MMVLQFGMFSQYRDTNLWNPYKNLGGGRYTFFFWILLVSKAIVFSKESNPLRRISNQRKVMLGSDGVEYSTSEYKYRKKLRVRVLILKNVLEYEYSKKVRVRVLLQI